MIKYLVNELMHGYEKVDITADELLTTKDNMCIIVLSKNCDSNIGVYYKTVTTLLKHNNRVIIIGLEDGNRVFSVIASLMVTYDAYDIYTVHAREDISAPYVMTLEKREPDIVEVQTYISGEIVAFTDMSNALFAIQNLVEDGDIEGLKSYVENNAETINNFVPNLNSMKKRCEEFNSNELIDAATDLKAAADKLQNKIKEQGTEIDKLKHDRDEKLVAAETAQRELVKLKEVNLDLKQQASTGGAVMATYEPLNLKATDVRVTAKHILYFKEISYVRYVNTLVTNLMNIFKSKKLNAKLIIYDSSSEYYAKYGKLQKIDGKQYNLQKDTLISRTPAFVVTEPAQQIIRDVVTSEQIYDVIIIYDRMGKKKDIVSNGGEKVQKFYVVNGSVDYYSIKEMFKLTSTDRIITNSNSSIEMHPDQGGRPQLKREFLDIPTIENFSTFSDTARTSKYMKAKSTVSGVDIVNYILEKSYIIEELRN
jgi:hypothetical protein